MSVTISVKVKREVAELADRMVKYGLARSRSHAINIMIEKGIIYAKEEVERWERTYEKVKELREKGLGSGEGSMEAT